MIQLDFIKNQKLAAVVISPISRTVYGLFLYKENLQKLRKKIQIKKTEKVTDLPQKMFQL